MGTSANINVKVGDHYCASYVNFDGYPEHTLTILKKHYTTQEAALQLVALGDLSGIDERANPTEGSGHSYATPEKGVCIAYGRDRGETGTGMQVSTEPQNTESYAYLFENGEWKII